MPGPEPLEAADEFDIFATFDGFVDIWAFDQRLPRFISDEDEDPLGWMSIDVFLWQVTIAPSSHDTPDRSLKDATRISLEHLIGEKPKTYVTAAAAVIQYLWPIASSTHPDEGIAS